MDVVTIATGVKRTLRALLNLHAGQRLARPVVDRLMGHFQVLIWDTLDGRRVRRSCNNLSLNVAIMEYASCCCFSECSNLTQYYT